MTSKRPFPSFSRRRAAHLRLGQQGEALACRVLAQSGLEILVRNYQSRQGEIDIVAREGETLCFVEVKTRRRALRSTPGEAVGRAKRQRIAAGAGAYLRAIGRPPLPCRFDIVEVVLPARGPIRLDHHRAAFISERALF